VNIRECFVQVVQKLHRCKFNGIQKDFALQNIENMVTSLRLIAYGSRIYLSDDELESLLSQFTLETCWDSGVEEATLSEAASYKQKLDIFGSNIRQAADRLEEVDRQGSIQFSSK